MKLINLIVYLYMLVLPYTLLYLYLLYTNIPPNTTTTTTEPAQPRTEGTFI